MRAPVFPHVCQIATSDTMTPLEMNVNREQRDEGGKNTGRRNERCWKKGGQFAYHHPDKCWNRLSINTEIRAELLYIRIFIHTLDLPYVVSKVVNHTPSVSLWEISFTCFVCAFTNVEIRNDVCRVNMRMYSSWVNSNLKKLHFEELGGKIYSVRRVKPAPLHCHKYSHINTPA